MLSALLHGRWQCSLRGLYLLLEFLAEALEGACLRVLLHEIRVSLDLPLLENRLGKGDMAEA